MSDLRDLRDFRDYCRAMSTAWHQRECHAFKPDRWGGRRAVWPDPTCIGCVSPSERTLFAQLADEIDAYLTPADDGPDLFGGG